MAGLGILRDRLLKITGYGHLFPHFTGFGTQMTGRENGTNAPALRLNEGTKRHGTADGRAWASDPAKNFQSGLR